MKLKATALLCLATLCFTCTNLLAQIDLPVGFDEELAVSETTSVYFFSEPGDFVGQGQEVFLTTDDGSFLISSNSDNGVGIRTPGLFTSFTADFVAPMNAILTTGLFEDARRFPFQSATEPGFNFSGDGRGSNMLSADFEILEIAFDASGDPIAFDAIFEQHSEFREPALFGRVRFNASAVNAVPEPSSLLVSMACLCLCQIRRRRK